MQIHLQHRGHQRFLTPLIALEDLRSASALPVRRHSLDLAGSCDECAVIAVGAASQSRLGPLTVTGLQSYLHLAFEHCCSVRPPDYAGALQRLIGFNRMQIEPYKRVDRNIISSLQSDPLLADRLISLRTIDGVGAITALT